MSRLSSTDEQRGARAGAARPGPLVAIDGPGGAGKSTVSRALAARLGVPRLDTGAMYRAVTWLALRRGIAPDDAAATAAIAESVVLDLDDPDRVLADGEDVTSEIRSPQVDAAVSAVAANPAVRAALVKRQQAWIAAHGGAVVEGRDIGAVVAPQAALKVYLTASPEERAERRAAQHDEEAAAVAAAIRRRDRLDSSREASPLAVAPGAVVVDSTGRSVDDVVDQLLGLLEVQQAPPEGATSSGGLVAGRPIRRSELLLYALCRMIVVGVGALFFPGPVVDAENIPAHGPYILAPVHRSNLDWLVVARLTRRRMRYLAKGGIWKVRAVGRFIELLGAFPVNRGAADRESLATALSVLAGGEPLVLFPEGTRRSGPRVEDVRDGAAYLALRAGVPIVPVGLAGTEEAMPRGRAFPRPGRVVLVVGTPILPQPIEPGGASSSSATGNPAAHRPRPTHVPRAALRATTEELVAALQSCLDRALALRAARSWR